MARHRSSSARTRASSVRSSRKWTRWSPTLRAHASTGAPVGAPRHRDRRPAVLRPASAPPSGGSVGRTGTDGLAAPVADVQVVDGDDEVEAVRRRDGDARATRDAVPGTGELVGDRRRRWPRRCRRSSPRRRTSGARPSRRCPHRSGARRWRTTRATVSGGGGGVEYGDEDGAHGALPGRRRRARRCIDGARGGPAVPRPKVAGCRDQGPGSDRTDASVAQSGPRRTLDTEVSTMDETRQPEPRSGRPPGRPVRRHGPTGRRGVDAARPMGRIVVGVDGSKQSRNALRWACADARAKGSVVVAVAVWHLYPLAPPERVGASPWWFTADPEEATRAFLGEVVDEVADDFPDVVVEQKVLSGPRCRAADRPVRGGGRSSSWERPGAAGSPGCPSVRRAGPSSSTPSARWSSPAFSGRVPVTCHGRRASRRASPSAANASSHPSIGHQPHRSREAVGVGDDVVHVLHGRRASSGGAGGGLSAPPDPEEAPTGGTEALAEVGVLAAVADVRLVEAPDGAPRAHGQREGQGPEEPQVVGRHAPRPGPGPAGPGAARPGPRGRGRGSRVPPAAGGR